MVQSPAILEIGPVPEDTPAWGLAWPGVAKGPGMQAHGVTSLHVSTGLSPEGFTAELHHQPRFGVILRQGT